MKEIGILLIIPCYNEYKRLPLSEIKEFLDKDTKGINLLFVNDGSTDQTILLLNDLKEYSKKVEVQDLKQNCGKAEAVRKAMLSKAESQFDYIGYFDADLATPLEEVFNFIPKIREHQALVLMGSRVKLLGSTLIERKWYRHYFGRIFATVVSNMLQLSVYDTQCGAKLIKREIIPVCFNDPFISSWLFDVEILFRIIKSEAYKTHPQAIVEIPLSKWLEKGKSKVPYSYILKIPIELMKINYRYKGKS